MFCFSATTEKEKKNKNYPSKKEKEQKKPINSTQKADAADDYLTLNDFKERSAIIRVLWTT